MVGPVADGDESVVAAERRGDHFRGLDLMQILQESGHARIISPVRGDTTLCIR